MPHIPDHYIFVRNEILSDTEISIYVNKTGTFYTFDPDGGQLNYGKVMDEVVHGSRGPLRRRKIQVKVPFIDREGRRGEATGIHTGSRNIIIKYPGQRKQQIDEHDAARGYFDPEMSDEALDQMNALEAGIKERQAKLRQLRDGWEVNLATAVRDAITAKMQSEDEAAWKLGAAAPDADDPFEDPFA